MIAADFLSQKFTDILVLEETIQNCIAKIIVDESDAENLFKYISDAKRRGDME